MKKGHVHIQIIEPDNEDGSGNELGYVYHKSLQGLNSSTCI